MKNVKKERLPQLTEYLHKASQPEFRNLFDHSPIPMWIYDLETYSFLDVNQAAVSNYGYSRQEFLNMTIKEIRPADDIPLLVKAVNRIRVTHRPLGNDLYRHRKKNGDTIYARIQGNVINLDGRMAEVVLAMNVTREHDSRMKLEEANIRLRTTQDIASIGYWTRELAKESFEWSDEAYEIFEQDRENFDCTFSNLVNTFHPEDRHMLYLDLDRTFPDDRQHNFESRIITKSGRVKWIFQRIRLIRNSQGSAIRIEGIVQDIDERKRNEQALLKKTKLLSATNKFMTGLLQHDDWTAALANSFAVIGETIEADRVYYFENGIDPANGTLVTSQKIEWTNNGVSPQVDNPLFQKIPFSMFAAYSEPLFNNQPFSANLSSLPDDYLREILEMQQVKSFLLLPVFVHGTFYGFIGFDDCSNERDWQEEAEFLKTIITSLATVIERNYASEEMKKSQRQLQSVIGNIPGITYRCLADENWTMIFLSDEIERITGYRSADFINNRERTFAQIIHPNDLPLTYGIMKKVKKKKPFTIEYRLMDKNGNLVWVKERGRGVYNAEGVLEYIDGVIIDITERIEKEKEIQESNERFKTVMKASLEAIIDWDIENDVTIWGNGFHELFGYDLTVYDNHLWSRNIHPEDKDRVLEDLQHTMNDPGKEEFYAEFRFLKAGGEIAFVQHRGIFIRNEEGKPVRGIASMIDMTENRRKTLEIEGQNRVLREIAWTQSHVVRAPLTRISGLVELFRHRSEMNLSEKELLDNLEIAVAELDDVIHSIVRKSESIELQQSKVA